MCDFLFAIYVTVLCEPSCKPDALSGILHIPLYVAVNFIHYIFFFHYFLICAENHLH